MSHNLLSFYGGASENTFLVLLEIITIDLKVSKMWDLSLKEGYPFLTGDKNGFMI